MSKLDSAITLDIEDNEEVADIFSEFGLQPQSPKLAEALFGSARQRSLDKVKASSSRRDSPTLPWRNPSVRSTAREPKRADRPSDTTFPPRSNSPDIDAIIAKTPRPRRSSTSVLSTPSPASRSLTSLGVRNRSPQNIGAKKVARDETSLISDFGALLEADSDLEDDNGSETDSSLDIHTPLPHLMFRDGLLSPRSKLLPQSSSSPFSYPEDIINSIDPRAASVLSVVSTAGSAMTKSGLQKDPRDTQRRRIRHRDGRLLRAGMGLTTGLGWSDSEDEDAPSALTRRLISTTIERKRSDSLASPSRRTSQYDETSRFGSPVPPSKSSFARKTASHSNLRSASVSFPSQARGTVTPTLGPGTGLRIPRGRAASSAATSISLTGSAKSFISSVPSRSNLSQNLAVTRSRAESSASTTSLESNVAPMPALKAQNTSAGNSSMLAHRAMSSTVTDSSDSLSFSSHSPPSSSDLHVPIDLKLNIRLPRARTDSNASASASTTSLASTYSQQSNSTASSSSTVPRPLHLPQTAGMKHSGLSFSRHTPSGLNTSVSTNSEISDKYQRLRTFSNPHSALRTPTSTTYHTPSRSPSSGVIPAGSPPTLRQRQVPAGARPRPRTGTGMMYRTSSNSYASFHESATRMRGSSAISAGSAAPF